MGLPPALSTVVCVPSQGKSVVLEASPITRWSPAPQRRQAITSSPRHLRLFKYNGLNAGGLSPRGSFSFAVSASLRPGHADRSSR